MLGVGYLGCVATNVIFPQQKNSKNDQSNHDITFLLFSNDCIVHLGIHLSPLYGFCHEH